MRTTPGRSSVAAAQTTPPAPGSALHLPLLLRRAAVPLFFLVAAVLHTWPMAAHLRDRVAWSWWPWDALFTSWSLPWGVREVFSDPIGFLLHPVASFHANVFFPEPAALAFADHMLGLAPIAAPFWFLTHDGVLTNNATTIVLSALAGYAAYLLAFEVCGDRSASIVAGLVFSLMPFNVGHAGHTNLLASYPMPLALLFGLRVVRKARIHDGVLLAVFWIGSMMSSWYYLIYVSIALGILVCAEAWFGRKRIRWMRVASTLLVVGVVVVGVAVVFSRPYRQVRATYPESIRELGEAEMYSPGPSSFLTVPPENRLYGDLLARFRPPSAEVERTLFPGFVPAALAAAGIVMALRRRRPDWAVPFVLIAMAMLAMAFGPYQKVFGHRVAMPFYYMHVMGLKFIRSVGRADVLAMLSVAVLCAVFLSCIRPRRERAVLCLAAGLLVCAEFASAPRPLASVPKPTEAHRWLARQAGEGAVLELPTGELEPSGAVSGASWIRDAVFMSFSTVHWKPIVNGYSGFMPPTYAEMVRAVRGFPDAASIRFLWDREIRYVVLERDWLPKTTWARLGTDQGIRELDAHGDLELAFDDGRAAVFRLTEPRTP